MYAPSQWEKTPQCRLSLAEMMHRMISLYSICHEICTQFCWTLFDFGFVIMLTDPCDVFTRLVWGCPIGIGTIVWLTQNQLCDPVWYGWNWPQYNHYKERHWSGNPKSWSVFMLGGLNNRTWSYLFLPGVPKYVMTSTSYIRRTKSQNLNVSHLVL